MSRGRWLLHGNSNYYRLMNDLLTMPDRFVWWSMQDVPRLGERAGMRLKTRKESPRARYYLFLRDGCRTALDPVVFYKVIFCSCLSLPPPSLLVAGLFFPLLDYILPSPTVSKVFIIDACHAKCDHYASSRVSSPTECCFSEQGPDVAVPQRTSPRCAGVDINVAWNLIVSCTCRSSSTNEWVDITQR